MPHAAARRRRQRSWYWYDWANSAFVTTTTTVLFSPYLTSVAKAAACPGRPSDAACHGHLSVLGIPVSPGSLVPYTITVSTIISAVLLLFVGAIADRVTRPAGLLGLFAWSGSVAACAMYAVSGTNWLLGVVLLIVANQCLGASLVIYNGLLVRISEEGERDRVSSHGWALGYLGGGLLLAANLAIVTLHGRFGLTTGQAVRISLLSAGLWWAIFTVIPVLGLRDVRHPRQDGDASGVAAVRGSLRQLRMTFGQLKYYPDVLMFLLAYLLFNDGIQTVLATASLYGKEELGFDESQLIVTILLVQFVAFLGALFFGRLAAVTGAQRAILWSLGLWTLVVAAAYVLPAHNFGLWLALGVGIGVVLGGSQALSRSVYSKLVPLGSEAEYFSVYQAMERGTSWFGTLTFGLVQQWSGSYRLAIFALVAFFALGAFFLTRVDMERGLARAGQR